MTKGKRILIRGGMLFALLGILYISVTAHAGQTQWVKQDGTPVTWPKGVTIKYQTDDVSAAPAASSSSGGGGGCILNKAMAQDTPADKLTTAEWQDMVAKGLKAWTDAVGGELVVQFTTSLGVDVDFTNVEKFLFGIGVFKDASQSGGTAPSEFNLDACLNGDAVNCPDGNNRWVYDPHGEIIDAIFGPCVRFERHGATATYPVLDAQNFPTSDIKHAESIINGTCLAPMDLPNVPATVNLAACSSGCKEEFSKTDFQGVITHEAGHWFGLDHSGIGKPNITECTKSPVGAACIKGNIQTMVGLPVPGATGELATLGYDDVATIRKYYTSATLDETAPAPYCTIKGIAYTSSGRGAGNQTKANQLRCAEVVATRDSDGNATTQDPDAAFGAGMVSGAESPTTTNTGVQTDCDATTQDCGAFTIRGLEAGKTYWLGIHNFAGGTMPQFDEEPCSPVLTSAAIGDDDPVSHSDTLAIPTPVKVTCPAGGGIVLVAPGVFAN